MRKLVALTGAGISAESGLKTFRDSDGLWESHRVEDVATVQAWENNPKLVLNFYNLRRMQMKAAKPNAAHLTLKELEAYFDVTVITQNVDDLHERAGSSNIIHLHGELTQCRSEKYPDLIYDVKDDVINLGDLCEKGYQLRPNIVWFGELVPVMEPAIEIVKQADILLIIGTSLQVYPAAGLVSYAPVESLKYLIDPQANPIKGIANLMVFNKKAGEFLPALKNTIVAKYL